MYRIDTTTDRGAFVLTARGELDAYAAPELDSALESSAGENRRLVVDLSQVTFLDSTALGTVNRAIRRLRSQGLEVPIVLPAGPARRIFEITGLIRVLAIFDSLDDALRAGS